MFIQKLGKGRFLILATYKELYSETMLDADWLRDCKLSHYAHWFSKYSFACCCCCWNCRFHSTDNLIMDQRVEWQSHGFGALLEINCFQVSFHINFNNYNLTFSENFGSLTFANSPSCFISSGMSGLSNVFVRLTSVWHTPYNKEPSLA